MIHVAKITHLARKNGIMHNKVANILEYIVDIILMNRRSISLPPPSLFYFLLGGFLLVFTMESRDPLIIVKRHIGE